MSVSILKLKFPDHHKILRAGIENLEPKTNPKSFHLIHLIKG